MEDQDDHNKVIFRVLYLFIHHKNLIVLVWKCVTIKSTKTLQSLLHAFSICYLLQFKE